MMQDPLETALARHFAPHQRDDACARRVLTALSTQALPPQRHGLWTRLQSMLPGILLTLDFTPAWPRVAALAACVVVGFGIGLAGLDATIQDASATVVASTDLSFTSLEPDSLTGLRP